MIYGNYIQTVPTLQSEKEAMLEALENELTYYNQLFLNESCFLDENTKMILEAKREVLQEAVGVALIAAIIAAIGALIALIIKGTKSVASKAVEVIKNTSNENHHFEKFKQLAQKVEETKNKSSKVNKNNSNDEEESEPIPLRDVKGSGKRIEQKVDTSKKDEEDLRKARDYYNKFVKEISTITYQKMTYYSKILNPDIDEFFGHPKDHPFIRIDDFRLEDIKDVIGELTTLAKEAITGDSKTNKSNKEYFDELMYKFGVDGICKELLGLRRAKFPDDMNKSLEAYENMIRNSEFQGPLSDYFGDFLRHIKGNDVNSTLKDYLKSLEKDINFLKSLEGPLKELKSIFERFKNKYKEEVSSDINRASGDSKKELQNYLLKVDATGIQNISKVISMYYKWILGNMNSYRKLAEYVKTNFTKVYIKSAITLALNEEPNLVKIPEFASLKAQYLGDDE